MQQLPLREFLLSDPLIKWAIPLPMSTTNSSVVYAAPPPSHPPLTTNANPFPDNLGTIGLGYAIAIAFGFLLLFSALLLASYSCCCRSIASRRRRLREAQFHVRNPHSTENSVYLPRIIFVAEDDDDSGAQNLAVGLEQAVINSYPKLAYSNNNSSVTGDDAVCSICLCHYKDSEILRMLPDCRHCFHLSCIDAWLKLNASCPVCRNSPLPTPLSTPLSEVVPISQYSDGRRRP